MSTRPRQLRYVGLDVHAETIAVAVAESSGEVRSLGVIANRPEAIRKMVHQLRPVERLRVCYEAGPCGYGLYWQCVRLGVPCDVVAPTLVPTKPGDRVKTDRRDALKLARCYRAGDLTPVWVPDAVHEALRDLVRAREAAVKDQLRARHRLGKFLLRQSRVRPVGMAAWTRRHRTWLETQHFAHPAQTATFVDYLHEVDHAQARLRRLDEALRAAVAQAPARMRAVVAALATLRGLAALSATSVLSEVGTFARFPHPRQLMGYSGAVPREHSSGSRIRRGGITKTGNAHLRRILTEAAWSYRHGPSCTGALKQRQAGQPPEITALAWAAQHRLCARYRALLARGKPQQVIVTALARELLGFIWAIGTAAERTADRAA
jgi:transposase